MGTEIVFCGPVNDQTASRLIRLIRETIDEVTTAVRESQKQLVPDESLTDLVDIEVSPKPIRLVLNTSGGSVHAAWAIVDTILNSKVDIHTVVSGFVASAGTLISIAGKKRFMYKHAHTLIHEVRSGAWGRYSDMRDHIANTDKLMNSLVAFYVERTNMQEDELRTLLSRDRYWDCEESLKNGLVDEII